MSNQVIRLQSKPKEVEAIKWENNEPYIRKFVADDSLLKFGDNSLRVWNKEEEDWINCPMFHYIIKGVRGEFYPISPEALEQYYTIIK